MTRTKNIVAALVLTLSSVILAEGTPTFKPADLVLPQGVSYSLGPVTLTRVLEKTTSTHTSGNTSSNKQSSGYATKRTNGTAAEDRRTNRSSNGYNFGGSIGGNSGGTGGFSLLGLIGLHADVGGKISNEDVNSLTSSSHNGVEHVSTNSGQNDSTTTTGNDEIEQDGSYHLMFSVVFKSKDLTDSFQIGRPNARVILNGFSAPVPVPYLDPQLPLPTKLGAEERVLFFDYPITHRKILDDAKRFVREGRRNAVTLSVNSDEFPVISDRTKKNVLEEVSRLMKVAPNTVIAIDFGEVQRLSPWRVRQKYPKASGRRGQHVTVREALLALNGIIANDDEMPDEAFSFTDHLQGLQALGDTKTIGSQQEGDLYVIAVTSVANRENAVTEVHIPNAAYLKRPLSDFTELHFVKLSLSELAQAHVYRPTQVATLVAEIEDLLKTDSTAQEFWNKLCTQFKTEKESAKNKPPEEVHRKGEKRSVVLPGDVKMNFCWCPPGTFMMGSPATEQGRNDNEVQHEVTLSRGFWMGETEVTQRQWRELMGTTVVEQGLKALKSDEKTIAGKTYRELLGLPVDADLQKLGFYGDVNDDVPVYFVSWKEAVEYCQKLTERERSAGRLPTGYEYRLPTEAEWEYACRAGSKTALPNDLEIEIKGECNAPALGSIAWYGGNSSVGYDGRYGLDSSGWEEREYPGGKAHARAVKSKVANAWGLYDMIGNVWEWCGDWYGDYETGSTRDPFGPASGAGRVSRGGGWIGSARSCRSAERSRIHPGYRGYSLGFRVALAPSSSR